MKSSRRAPAVRAASPAYRPAFEWLDAALEENTSCDNREKIRLLRLALFADVDALEKSGKVVIPK